MDSITIQSEIARLRIQDRLMEAGRMREARGVYTPRRPRPRDPERSR